MQKVVRIEPLLEHENGYADSKGTFDKISAIKLLLQPVFQQNCYHLLLASLDKKPLKSWFRKSKLKLKKHSHFIMSHDSWPHRLTETSDSHEVAEMYWFPYCLDRSMRPEILAGQDSQHSQYNSKSEVRLIATDNMVSHGALTDLSIGNEDPKSKIVIGNIILYLLI